jgi:large subunit ribosomal protein L4
MATGNTTSDRENTATGTITVAIRNLANETVGEASLPEEIFGVPFRRHLVWEVIKGIRAREHRGTHKVKVRSEVSGSGKKPFKQKHTGRARQGGGRPPIHRHGGTVHGPTPHSYDLKVNAKAKKQALKCVLSEKIRENRFVLIENLELANHKTKDLAGIAAKLGLDGKTLLVDRRDNENLSRAARNHPWLEVVDALGMDAYNALDAQTLVVTEHALRVVTEVLG